MRLIKNLLGLAVLAVAGVLLWRMVQGSSDQAPGSGTGTFGVPGLPGADPYTFLGSPGGKFVNTLLFGIPGMIGTAIRQGPAATIGGGGSGGDPKDPNLHSIM
jgi:hypothetical protein